MKETKKYYWMNVSRYNARQILLPVCNKVTDVHPFTEVYNMTNKEERYTYVLNSWRQIDVDEWNLWNTLNNK